MTKLISIVTPTYNEEDNIDELVARIRSSMAALPLYDYEHIVIDNASTDGTREKLRALATRDPRLKLIFNARNFGQVRSPVHALFQAQGVAAVCLASDLQDPPELIPRFVEEWEAGAQVVAGVMTRGNDSLAFSLAREAYYRILVGVSAVRTIPHFTGFGLYDRKVIEVLRKIDDPNPYVRGLVSELGFRTSNIAFDKPRRKRGLSKNNLLTLYDIAILGMTTHTKAPMRLASILGLGMGGFSFVVAMVYLAAKLLFWDRFEFGLAPVLIGIFFFSSVQLFIVGLIGEYIGAILTHVRRMPLVVELERINFNREDQDNSQN